MLGTLYGFVFSGCQMFYSKIELDNVIGVVFDTFNFGNSVIINIKGGGSAMFTHCMFGSEPVVDITANEYTRFINCYTRDGAPLIRNV